MANCYACKVESVLLLRLYEVASLLVRLDDLAGLIGTRESPLNVRGCRISRSRLHSRWLADCVTGGGCVPGLPLFNDDFVTPAEKFLSKKESESN